MARKGESKPAPAAGRGGARTSSLDVEALRQIVELLEASEVTRLVWSNGTERVSIRRGAHPVVHQVVPVSAGPAVTAVVTPAPAPAPEARPAAPAARPSAEGEAAPAAKGHVITSPFVGTFYRSAAPDQPPFAEVGSLIRKGQVLCIVEAMKLMNEIESEVAGKVVEVLVQNAQPVEFGQPLFRIEPA